MKKIVSSLIKYNANSKNNNAGDCVKRALSYAYGVSYDTIHRELNKLKRDIGASQYNSRSVYTRFLMENGAIPISKDKFIGMTEERFSEVYSHGIYILLSGSDTKDYATHMVCIMNGNIIDSWDSSLYIVREAYEIKDVSLDTFDVTFDDVAEELASYVDKYLEKLNNKYDQWFTLELVLMKSLNESSGRVSVALITTDEVPDESIYCSSYQYIKNFVIKISPRISLEENLKSIETKIKQQIYDWMYPIKKDIEDSYALEQLQTHSKYTSNSYYRKQLLRLPEWCRKYVRYFYDNSNNSYSNYRYELELEAMPQDPRYKISKFIDFNADNMKELLHMLEDYKNEFKRPNYDY